MKQQGIPLAVKRLLDSSAATLGLLGLWPVLAGSALAIRLVMGSPVLFRQQRPGKNGVPFEVLKFRTMNNAHDSQGQLLPDAERLNPLGAWLRASSIDELPQLLNVLKGEMSLVGPRPLLVKYLERYSPKQSRRHEVLPGITGWAQVNGRNALSWEEKFELDTWYVDNWSLGLDLKILAMTLAQVLRRQGIANSEAVTMPEFLGSAVSKSLADALTPPTSTSPDQSLQTDHSDRSERLQQSERQSDRPDREDREDRTDREERSDSSNSPASPPSESSPPPGAKE